MIKMNETNIQRVARSVAREAINELRCSTYNNAMCKSSKRMRNARANGDDETADKELDRAARFSTAAADAYNRENPKRGGRKHKDVVDESNKNRQVVRIGESKLRQLVSSIAASCIRESRRRQMVKEATTDHSIRDKWNEAIDVNGADVILEAIYQYLTADQIAKLVELLDRDGYCPEPEEYDTWNNDKSDDDGNWYDAREDGYKDYLENRHS